MRQYLLLAVYFKMLSLEKSGILHTRGSCSWPSDFDRLRRDYLYSKIILTDKTRENFKKKFFFKLTPPGPTSPIGMEPTREKKYLPTQLLECSGQNGLESWVFLLCLFVVHELGLSGKYCHQQESQTHTVWWTCGLHFTTGNPQHVLVHFLAFSTYL